MIDSRTAPYAALTLRVALGLMFLAHGVLLKWLTYSLAGTADFFESVGLFGWLAYAVFAAEVVGGTCLILGVHTRWIALGLSPILVGATVVHWGNGWVFTAAGGGWEYPLFLTILAVVQFLLGDGHLALRPSARNRERRDHSWGITT